MNTAASILATVGTSVAVSALVSSLIALYGQKLEREARKNELALTLASDLSKAYIGRVLEQTKGLAIVPELSVLGLMYNSVRDILEHSVISKEGLEGLKQLSVVPKDFSEPV